MAGGGVRRIVALVACGLLATLAAALAHPAVAPAKRGLVTGFADDWLGTRPAIRPNVPPGWTGPLRRGPGSYASISLGVPSRPSAAPRSHQPRQRLLRLLGDRRGGARCRSPWSRRAPDDLRRPGLGRGHRGARRRQLRAPGSRTPPTSPTSCGRSRHATRVASTPTAPARRRRFLPCRRCRSGTSPTSHQLLRRNTRADRPQPRPLPGDAQRRLRGGEGGGPEDARGHRRHLPLWRCPRRQSGPTRAVSGEQVLCVHETKKKKKKKKKGASKRVFVRTQNCPAPVRFDVLAHHPINTSGGPRRSAINPDDASSPDLDRIVRVLRGAETAGTVSAGSASGLGDGDLVGQQPAEPRGRPPRYPGALDRAGALSGSGRTARAS